MRKVISTGFVMLAGLLASPAPNTVTRTNPTVQEDPRVRHLANFFRKTEAPVRSLAPEFIQAADRHTLDWRLLPSIAFVESGAGKQYMNNNIFGWDSGKRRFPSVRAGIHAVAARLATSDLYRGKSVKQILHTYNPRDGYAVRVMRVMKSIGPAQPLVQSY